MVRDDRDAHFRALLKELEGWYADSVRAMAYDSSGGSFEAEHVILRVQPYPGPDWRARWHTAADDDQQREGILRALEEELYGLTHGPSQASPASGLHRGTSDWRQAVATADGSLRAVARRYGISHTEVRRIRLEYAQ